MGTLPPEAMGAAQTTPPTEVEGTARDPHIPHTTPEHTHGSTSVTIHDLMQLVSAQTRQQELQMQQWAAAQLRLEERMQERMRLQNINLEEKIAQLELERALDTATRGISGAELAKAACACPHAGNTAHGKQWWAGARGVVRRLNKSMFALAESRAPAASHERELNRDLYEFVMACIDQSNPEGIALVRVITQQQPSVIDDGWAVRRILMGVDENMTSLEADAIYDCISKKRISLDASKAAVLNIAHEITEQWDALPANRKGHSRRNVELLIDAIPSVAEPVTVAVRSVINTADALSQPPLSLDAVAGLIFANLSQWRIANPSAADPNWAPRAHYTDMKCLSCGDSGHSSSACPNICNECGFSFCGKNLGKPCAVTAKAEMPARVFNFFGRPIPKSLYDKLVAKRAELAAAPETAGGGANGALTIQFFEDGPKQPSSYAFHAHFDYGDCDLALESTCIMCSA